MTILMQRNLISFSVCFGIKTIHMNSLSLSLSLSFSRKKHLEMRDVSLEITDGR